MKTIDNGWYVLRCGEEAIKLIQLKADTPINLGRAGVRVSSKLVGLSLGVTYVTEGEAIRRIRDEDRDAVLAEEQEAPTSDVLDGGKNSDGTPRSNQLIFDDNTAQRLNFETIEKMKENQEGSSIVRALVENSDSFAKKTIFAQEKYLRRKKCKYLPSFSFQKITTRALWSFYFDRHPDKILNIRFDALSLLLTESNVKANSHVLVVDDTHGFITGAILERMIDTEGNSHGGKMVVFHQKEQPLLDIMKYHGFSQTVLEDMLYTMSFPHLLQNHEQLIQEYQARLKELEAIVDASPSELGEIRKLNRLQKISTRNQQTQKLLDHVAFDSMILVSQTHPSDILEKILKYLGPSRPFVIYSECAEPLAEVYLMLRRESKAVHLNLREIWLRNYQVLSMRTHPEMNMHGASGYLLSGIRV